MREISGFIAYPSEPELVGRTVAAAIEALGDNPRFAGIQPWPETKVAGRFIGEAILSSISASDVMIADVTYLNFNVTFEVGFAVGRGKDLLLVRNRALEGQAPDIAELGIFDTLGYQEYESSAQLVDLMCELDSLAHKIPVDTFAIDKAAPLYVIYPRTRTDSEIRISARIHKARLNARSYDPEEQGRLSAAHAIDNVASSYGIVAPLLQAERSGSFIHNLRVAFVAGLATGLDKRLLLLQEGNEPVPLDYRDLVHSYTTLDQINGRIAEFATEVYAQYQRSDRKISRQPPGLLARLAIGASAAENEVEGLGSYYLKTDEFERARRGEAQVIAGRKGSGKTALFVRLSDEISPRQKNLWVKLGSGNRPSA